jgi:hypothetical protein
LLQWATFLLPENWDSYAFTVAIKALLSMRKMRITILLVRALEIVVLSLILMMYCSSKVTKGRVSDNCRTTGYSVTRTDTVAAPSTFSNSINTNMLSKKE